MKLREIIAAINLTVLVGKDLDQKDVKGVYICDLLSNVMAHGREDDLWITIQVHQNILAVASLLNFTAILLPEGHLPDQLFLEKAKDEGLVVLQSELGAFELAGRLYELGLRGN